MSGKKPYTATQEIFTLPRETKEGFFFDGTGQAISFCQLLQVDRDLADACSKTDLRGRLDIAEEQGFDFTEENLRGAIRIWDFSGEWRQWLAPGRICESLDDLPDLQDCYAITAEQKDAYQRDGHILVEQVLSQSEVAVYRAAVRRAVAKFAPHTVAAQQTEINAYQESGHISAFNLRQQDDAVLRLVLAKRLGRIAADLMGVEGVRIYMDEAFNKEPGQGITHWHQDRTYFPPETDQLMSMWIPLVDITEDMGGLIFVTGSHKAGNLGYHPIDQESSNLLGKYIEEEGLPVSRAVAMRAGDATFHNGWCLHSAGPNKGKRTREALTVVYYPDGTRLAEPDNRYHVRAIELAFPGKSPGDLAVSPIHQLVYQATQAYKQSGGS